MHKKEFGFLVIALVFVAAFAVAGHFLTSVPFLSPADDSSGDAPTMCGNGICDAGESSKSCPSDCPVISPRQQEGIIVFRHWLPPNTHILTIEYLDIASGQITEIGEGLFRPQVKGNYIVYYRTIYQPPWNSYIMVYDIVRGVLSEPGIIGQNPSIDYPIISYNAIVEQPTRHYEVAYYNMETGENTLIGIIDNGYETFVDGDYIIYFEEVYRFGDLKYYDMRSGLSTLISDRVERWSYDISDNLVVFTKLEPIPGTTRFINKIYYYDINTGITVNTTLTAHYWNRGYAFVTIGGNKIAFDNWEGEINQDLNGDGDMSDFIVGYHNIETGQTKMFAGEGINPQIDKNIIAYNDERYPQIVKYYDINTGTEFSIGEIGDNSDVYVPID